MHYYKNNLLSNIVFILVYRINLYNETTSDIMFK